MKLLAKRVAAVTVMAFMISLFIFPLTMISAASRDCDSNALIYCGTLTVDELSSKLSNGTGKSYQSAAELQKLFSYYGIGTSDFGSLRSGYVTNDNRVVLDGQTIKTNVYTMGRSYMPGSTKLTQFPYPVYLRHPSVSFRSSQISAFIKLNPDNTMAYAILKSCGNIVPGEVYVRPQTPEYRLYALKWLDLNGNGKWESDEPRHPGVTFRISGNNISKTAVTDSMGYAWFYGIPAGTYTITEVVPNNFEPTTPTTRTVLATGESGSRIGVTFGNKPITEEEETGELRVFKFNDINGNKVQDNEEPAISGWNFRVAGPNNSSFELTTDANGYASRSDLDPGIYTVTEVLEDGWSVTTDLSLHRDVRAGAVTTYIFGNRLYSPPSNPKGGGDTLPVSGPVAVATMAGSAALFSGSAVAWARSKKKFLHSFRK